MRKAALARRARCYGSDVTSDARSGPDRSLTSPDARTGVIAGATAYAIWGLFPLYFHRLDEVRPFEIACLRILTTCVLVWVILAARGRARSALAAITDFALLV